MNKAFKNFTWENSPSAKTPINETNLMKINNALDEVDRRVVEYDDTKFNTSEGRELFKDASFDSSNGVITFTRNNGTTKEVETLLDFEAQKRELTQAEYDALSTEEKMNGTIYFITDAD